MKPLISGEKYTYLQDIYQKRAKFTVIFISEHYAKKLWTNHERKMAQARAFNESEEYILPARFDDTVIEGIPSTTAFIDLRNYSPQEFSILIQNKLGFDSTNSKIKEKIEPQWEVVNTNSIQVQLMSAAFPRRLTVGRMA